MINVAIVEDNKREMETLKTYLDRYGEENGLAFNAVWFDNAIKFLDSFNPNYDIVLLDIELPYMNGMDAAQKLREVDKEVSLIFVTNMAQYAIKGYEVDAEDFIVKPVSYYNFALKVGRVLKKVKGKNDIKVAVNVDSGSKYILLSDIRYVEVMKHKLFYHTVEGVYEMRGSLKKMEPVLAENNFVKCNNYCMVNLRYVMGIKGMTISISKERGISGVSDEIAVSHPRKKLFVKALNDYLGGN